MKQFSSLEIHYLIKELQFLINSKVDQIYHPSKKELIIQLYVTNQGKRILKITPKIFFLTETRQQTKNPSQFCLFLRKYLINSRLTAIKQLEFERIVQFDFKTKDQTYSLILELFSTGNIIFSKNSQILMAAEHQKWKQRTIAPKQTYSYPKKEYNFLELKEKDLKTLLQKTNKENLVKALAIDLGLGGLFAEESCLLSKINKNKKPKQTTDQEIASLIKTFKNLKTKKINPQIIYKNKEIEDITPFKLEFYKNLKQESFKIYNQLLDFYFSKQTTSIQKQKFRLQLEKIQKIIQKQKSDISTSEKSIQENHKKAELIYQNYNLIKDVMEQINKATKKYTWKEIKEKLKGHKIIKEINPKDKTIVLEL
ncbi:NFACT family protein [Candidatus Woesearchaeota archaeon]|nr:NFACT family protein [Candidatus Woesearchaeota archaeon]